MSLLDSDDAELKMGHSSRIRHGILAFVFGICMWLIESRVNVVLFQSSRGFFRSTFEAIVLLARVPGAFGMTLLHIGPWSGKAVEVIGDFILTVFFFASGAYGILRLLARRRSYV